jgi:hypothetical protein
VRIVDALGQRWYLLGRMKAPGAMTAVYIDADACPVREEALLVAEKRELQAFVVANGSRPLPRPRYAAAELVLVAGQCRLSASATRSEGRAWRID